MIIVYIYLLLMMCITSQIQIKNSIYNIELGRVVWRRGAHYESPMVNIFNDTLECDGDLSPDAYVFNKYGKLIEIKNQ